MEKKLSTPIDFLCKGLPTEFVTFLTYARNLRFEDKPDYTYIKTLLKDLFIKSGFELDWQYDWNIIAQEKKKTEESKALAGGAQQKTGEKDEEEKMAIEKEASKGLNPNLPEDKGADALAADKKAIFTKGVVPTGGKLPNQ